MYSYLIFRNNFSYQIFIKNKDVYLYTFRVKQVEELMDSFIKNSKADAVILGGDFNTPPLMDPGQPYEIIQRYMKNKHPDLLELGKNHCKLWM